MKKIEPYYSYAPDSLGWLERKAEAQANIVNADIVRIIEANPTLIPNELLRSYIVKGLHGNLKAKRGRKSTPFWHTIRDSLIVAMYEDLLPRLQKRARRQRAKGIKKARSDRGPSELACHVIGQRFRMTGESVLNLISSHNQPPK